MQDTEQARRERERQEDLARLRGLRPIDDDFMHDFSCWDPDDMNYALMEEATRYYKETPERVEYMCKAFEEVRNESFSRGMQQGMQQGIQQGMQQGMQQNAISNIKSLMMNMNWTPLQAMDALSIPAEDQPKYAEMLSV